MRVKSPPQLFLGLAEFSVVSANGFMNGFMNHRVKNGVSLSCYIVYIFGEEAGVKEHPSQRHSNIDAVVSSVKTQPH